VKFSNTLFRLWVQREKISQEIGFILLHPQQFKAFKSCVFPAFFRSQAVCFKFLFMAKITVNQKCEQTENN